ncbi:amidase [Tumebacillus sp. BK434]|uniref:amidase family protein n=1 Tax=Tumebacillus sp. BK434 TaxID=2512169 RepID=UPI00104D7226|nr:amidase family protein [Tumebacillus sp. BK434]TCP57585.1 amidase [Tumebacillus sp. BK434]
MNNPRLQQLSETWLIEATIDDMQQRMADGTVTAHELVLMYLWRIAAYDQQGPQLKSVLEINPDALQIAAALDAERKRSGPRGPMHGIPVILKDNIDTADKMHTSAGSRALAASIAPEDAFVVKQLRAAGAVLLGKANMTEWANFMAHNMPTGYSSRGGQSLNPYGATFMTGGSSAGSGITVGANLTAVAVGTETSGSILSPASQNSIVGLKPTVGLISRSGIIPLAHSQDTAGPMARTVRDAAILLNALTGVDANDPITATSAEAAQHDYTAFLKAGSLQGIRLGVATHIMTQYELPAEKKALIDAALDVLRELGAEVCEVELPHFDQDWSSSKTFVHEFKSDLNAYLHRLGPAAPIRSLQELIAFNDADPERMLKYGQAHLIAAEATSGTLVEPDYILSRERDLYWAKEAGLDAMMAEHRLHAWIAPNNWGAMYPAIAGYPSITVPAGYVPSGEPVGVTFSAGAYSEPLLFQLAYAYEQATQHRKAPVLAKGITE